MRLSWCVVSKVGRKYFYCETHKPYKGSLGPFHKDTGREKSDFTVCSQIHPNPREWQEAVRTQKVNSAIQQEMFRNRGWLDRIGEETRLALMRELGVQDEPLPELPEIDE